MNEWIAEHVDDPAVRLRMQAQLERVRREETEWREARLHEFYFGVIVHPSECEDCADGTHKVPA